MLLHCSPLSYISNYTNSSPRNFTNYYSNGRNTDYFLMLLAHSYLVLYILPSKCDEKFRELVIYNILWPNHCGIFVIWLPARQYLLFLSLSNDETYSFMDFFFVPLSQSYPNQMFWKLLVISSLCHIVGVYVMRVFQLQR